MTNVELPSALQSLDPAELVKATLALPDDERDVVSARFKDHLAFGRIAEALGLPADLVAKRYRRGVRRLHRRLGLGAWARGPASIRPQRGTKSTSRSRRNTARAIRSPCNAVS